MGQDKKFVWCGDGSEFDQKTLDWGTAQSSSAAGNCLFGQLSNNSANYSSYAMGQCDNEKNFVCEVYFSRKLSLQSSGNYFSHRKLQQLQRLTAFKTNAWSSMISQRVNFNLK